jgi:Na+/proline symporter
MPVKFYSLIIFVGLFWFYCLYWAFKNQSKIITPVDFFIYGRQLPGWVFIIVATGTIFSGWIFFVHPSLIFMNGMPYSMTSLCVIGIPLLGIVFLKRQWMLSKKYGFVTPGEMMGVYFRSDFIRVLIVIITLGFAIPFIAMQLSLGGILISILSDDIIGAGLASFLIGGVIIFYLSISGIKSIVYIDTIQFLFVIFGVVSIGFITLDLVGGWDLLNESLSRISNIKKNLFNLKESYSSYLAIPGTIKFAEILDKKIFYSGIWTSSMILTFVFALTGIQMSPNFLMLVFSSKEVKPFAAQQVWFSAFLIGLIFIFFTIIVGVGSNLLGANNIINESGNNISKILPSVIFPNEMESLVPHLINTIGEYSPLFFGILAICAIASVQSTSYFYLSSSAIVTRDIVRRFFLKKMNNEKQIFSSRILLGLIFIISLVLSIQSLETILSVGIFSLSIACQMFVPLIAICYFPWLTKQGVGLGIVVGIITVLSTDIVGQMLFGDFITWNKWPLTIHSSVWGVLFNLIAAISISFITQDAKETNHKQKFHDFIDDYKSHSIMRKSLKPSAWIVTITWIFFALGPGSIIGNNIFGKPGDIESWSFGAPSIWVWEVISWILGIILIWFLAVKMEMSTSPEKNIIAQTEDIGSTLKG